MSRAMLGAGGFQTQLIASGCVILFLFVVRAPRGEEAIQQDRDCREQTQQEEELQKINSVHFDPLKRSFDRNWVNDNEQ